MRRQNFYIGFIVALGLILGLFFPWLDNAAVNDAKNDEQEIINTAITPDFNKENSKNEEYSLENEPATLGKLLYENHCITCHESLVHIREAQKAKTYGDIQYWVGRWALELDVKWSADEIDAVVQHLNDTFYNY